VVDLLQRAPVEQTEEQNDYLLLECRWASMTSRLTSASYSSAYRCADVLDLGAHSPRVSRPLDGVRFAAWQ